MDYRADLAHKLTETFAHVVGEYPLRRDDKADAEFWRVWNVVNAAAAKLGVPYHETPAVRPVDFKRITPQDF